MLSTGFLSFEESGAALAEALPVASAKRTSKPVPRSFKRAAELLPGFRMWLVSTASTRRGGTPCCCSTAPKRT